jgi:hypothetical protein
MVPREIYKEYGMENKYTGCLQWNALILSYKVHTVGHLIF